MKIQQSKTITYSIFFSFCNTRQPSSIDLCDWAKDGLCGIGQWIYQSSKTFSQNLSSPLVSWARLNILQQEIRNSSCSPVFQPVREFFRGIPKQGEQGRVRKLRMSAGWGQTTKVDLWARLRWAIFLPITAPYYTHPCGWQPKLYVHVASTPTQTQGTWLVDSILQSKGLDCCTLLGFCVIVMTFWYILLEWT